MSSGVEVVFEAAILQRKLDDAEAELARVTAQADEANANAMDLADALGGSQLDMVQVQAEWAAERSQIRTDLGKLAELVGLGDYARPISPHEFFGQCIEGVVRVQAELKNEREVCCQLAARQSELAGETLAAEEKLGLVQAEAAALRAALKESLFHWKLDADNGDGIDEGSVHVYLDAEKLVTSSTAGTQILEALREAKGALALDEKLEEFDCPHGAEDGCGCAGTEFQMTAKYRDMRQSALAKLAALPGVG